MSICLSTLPCSNNLYIQCSKQTARAGALTNALDTVQEYIDLLARSQQGNEDVIIHWPDGAFRKEVSLVPQGHPRHVPGVNWKETSWRASATGQTATKPQQAFLLTAY